MEFKEGDISRCFSETIKDFPGYIICKDGGVVSLERKVKKCEGIFRKVKGHILKESIDVKGYSTVRLYKNKEAKTFRIHRLVADTFLLNPEKQTTG